MFIDVDVHALKLWSCETTFSVVPSIITERTYLYRLAGRAFRTPVRDAVVAATTACHPSVTVVVIINQVKSQCSVSQSSLVSSRRLYCSL